MNLEVDEELIDSVCARVRGRLPEGEAEQAVEFVRQYYRWVAPDDLAERSPLDVYGLALAHYGFARERAARTTKVRVYNPQFDEHGWQSTHTAVEIVTDDVPFLIDSVAMELNGSGFGVHLIIHPVITVRRDGDGHLTEILPPGASDGLTESVIHVEVDRQTDPDQLKAVRERLLRVIGEVDAAVEDWRPMRERALQIAAELQNDPPPLDAGEVAEAAAFLTWLEDRHFTFLGYREYDVVTDTGEVGLVPVDGSGLGILRESVPPRDGRGFESLPPAVRALALDPYLLNLTKANSRATVHRPSYLDYVGVKRLHSDGKVVGERRFLGLYTHTAYHASPRDIPILRRKFDAVLARAAFPPASHNEKALVEILESHPRDELLQVSVDELFTIAMGILHLGERQRVRLFARRDTFGRFLSCLVFVPRDRFNTENRQRIEKILGDAFDATSIDYTTRVSESVLVRLHYMVYVDPGRLGEYDPDEIEQRLVAATRSWLDDLQAALIDDYGEERGNELLRRYADAFPPAYRADWPARRASADVRHVEELADDGLFIRLYRPLEAPPGALRAKLLRSGAALSLSGMLPTFENLGIQVADERPYELTPVGRRPVWLYDFGLTFGGPGELEPDEVRGLFEDAFVHAWRGDVEDDGYNRLVLRAGLTWRQITILRALARYLRQAGSTFSDTYIERAAVENEDVAKLLVELFCARFDPDARDASADAGEASADAGEANADAGHASADAGHASADAGDASAAQELVGRIEAAIDGVQSLDQDRILRSFLDGITGMLRTNYFQTDESGAPKAHLSFKLDSAHLSWLPLPRPHSEMFVYSPRTEAVHLRGGKVARGGIRWSDRREDFRTEVLGLMKAQMVKNAVIVPVGAKGGFVVKRPPAGGDAEALKEEVVACYETFIRGLLDLTDNIVRGEIAPPPRVVRYDEDDPYLVVAADRGTASFSDIANGIAAEYGLWLGDAFASGGSTGYDHKRMGITARGAWVSVERHFRELGRDVATEDFTVVGIGDMSGDVFGNGMLLSPHTRLVAAFNHRHIFIDPDPDLEASLRERRRLFELAGSAWSDYDPDVISSGGGVYERSAKSIDLSAEARSALGIEASALAPNELVRALLRAPVDLLWNGGIGTYVKADAETAAEVGDKANDAVRVNASELRCRVIAEGGNLGLTQRARVQYALAGGRLNTDAIDNSAGVDCSDHEVNIKVLLDAIVADGDLTRKQRNALLVEMTDSVAESVLKDNYEQTETLSLSEAQAADMVDVHTRLIRYLEVSRRLNREVESLPGDDDLAERKRGHRGLTRPELAALLAYAKVDLFRRLVDSDVPEDPYLSRELEAYFPHPLPERYAERMNRHRLRREITATRVVNNMLHGGGITFAFRLHDETGAPAADLARAYTGAREVFQMRQQWAEIEALDYQVDAAVQNGMLLAGRRLVERGARWLLRTRPDQLDIAATVARFAPGAATLYEALPRLLDPSDAHGLAREADRLQGAGVPRQLALRVAGAAMMVSVLDIVEVADETGLDVEEVAAVHLHLGGRLQLHWLRERIAALPRDDRWTALARAALRDDLYALHRVLTGRVLTDGSPDGQVDRRVNAWIAANPAAQRYGETIADIRASQSFTLTTLSVALRELRNLIQAPVGVDVGAGAADEGAAAADEGAAAAGDAGEGEGAAAAEGAAPPDEGAAAAGGAGADEGGDTTAGAAPPEDGAPAEVTAAADGETPAPAGEPAAPATG